MAGPYTQAEGLWVVFAGCAISHHNNNPIIHKAKGVTQEVDRKEGIMEGRDGREWERGEGEDY